DAAQAEFAAIGADAAVVAAYGLILPPPVLAAPRLGCLNVHASLLPRWRGAAPIQRAILAVDRETGVTIMQMEAGLDTGPILLQQPVPIQRAILAVDRETGVTIMQMEAGLDTGPIPLQQPAPIQRAILAVDRETGVTIMQMEAGLDTGPILLQQPVPILPDTTAGELTETLAELG